MGWWLVSVWWLAACRHDATWEAPSGVSGSPRFYELTLDGVVIGGEVWWGRDGTVVRRRVTEWTVDGIHQRAASEVTVRPTGGGWEQRTADEPWRPVGLSPEMFPVEDGSYEIVDVFGGTAGRGRVWREDEVLRVDGPLGPSVLRFDGGTFRQGSFGRLGLRAVTDAPHWTAPELTELLSLVVPSWGGLPPRRARVARWEVDGVSRAETSPLRGELPRRPWSPPEVVGEVGRWASDAVGPAQDRWTVVERLATGVRDELRHEPRIGRATADEVLRDPRGDCTEHVTLFLAAAAALGIDARPVTGLLLVATDDGGQLRPHAWAEVVVDGRWVAVDPTLGMAPADAARVGLGHTFDEGAARFATSPRVTLHDLR